MHTAYTSSFESKSIPLYTGASAGCLCLCIRHPTAPPEKGKMHTKARHWNLPHDCPQSSWIRGDKKKKKGALCYIQKVFPTRINKKSAADEENPCRRSRKSRTWIEETLDDRKEKEKWLIVSYEINRFWIYHSLWLLYWATIGDQGESETSATAISDYVFSLSYNKRFTYVISDAIVYHLCNDAIRFIQAVGD